MNDRELLEAKYTSPSGKEILFLWEKILTKTTELKTGVFTFPDRDGAHVQHQGGGAVSFPMNCIFNSDDHIDKANEFELALLERDVAELQHPIYGIIKVIPTGDISRDNDLINSVNESHVAVTFTETIVDDPVNLEAVSADEIESSFEDFTEAAAVEFSENIVANNINEKLLVQSMLDAQSNIMNDNLSDVAGNNNADFLTSMRELKNNIKTVFGKTENEVISKLNIARNTLQILKMSSRININITEKIKGYSRLTAQIINQFKNDPFGINNIKNAFVSTRLVLTGAVASIASGAALSIATSAASNTGYLSGGVLSRESAVTVTVQLKDLLTSIQNYEDTKIEQNTFIDSNATSYYTLVEIVHNSINLILNVSFSLPMKRIIKLKQDRNVIELCAELYNSVEDFYVDKLIVENNLSIDDLEIIPMGREIFYYV